MSLHVMTDIETLSTTPDAAILSIGACSFRMNSEVDADPEDTFEVRISIESNERAGRHISGSTVQWWLQQSQEAQAALFEGNIVPIRNALTQLQLWIGQLPHPPTHIWAKDPDFDVVILRNAFEQFNMPWPFKFWMSRSVRTITELAYPNDDAPNLHTGVKHSALADAIAQMYMVRLCYQKLVHGKPL